MTGPVLCPAHQPPPAPCLVPSTDTLFVIRLLQMPPAGFVRSSGRRQLGRTAPADPISQRISPCTTLQLTHSAALCTTPFSIVHLIPPGSV
ncbi:unnamed protein product [Heligmosomoides polygyrus]|uniref:Uncharacterized protein n=1 Tax=Heligmosomoides polygyrus TaxID=6339 RepID=A0A183FHF9_HELPZ|nr:unnamed protein product [Heligmosomoides polygyrus]